MGKSKTPPMSKDLKMFLTIVCKNAHNDLERFLEDDFEQTNTQRIYLSDLRYALDEVIKMKEDEKSLRRLKKKVSSDSDAVEFVEELQTRMSII